MIQQYIVCPPRVLRVVKIGDQTLSYWKVGEKDSGLAVNLAAGAGWTRPLILVCKKWGGRRWTRFCRETGVNLAGFDLIFGSDLKENEPYFLEINYFFGRKGLGGSQAYYDLLTDEIRRWVRGLDCR